MVRRPGCGDSGSSLHLASSHCFPLLPTTSLCADIALSNEQATVLLSLGQELLRTCAGESTLDDSRPKPQANQLPACPPPIPTPQTNATQAAPPAATRPTSSARACCPVARTPRQPAAVIWVPTRLGRRRSCLRRPSCSTGTCISWCSPRSRSTRCTRSSC